MIRIHLALVGAAALALAACGSQNEDALEDNIGENLQQDELNALANDAAMDARAEMEALSNQQQQLEEAPAEEPVNADAGVVTEPSEIDDEPLGL